jgi:hypothetical protein
MIDTVKLTRKQIVENYKLVASRKDATFSPKFSFFILRNLKFMEEEVTTIGDLETKLQTILGDYEKRRSGLAVEHADKDEDGKPVLINNNTAFKMESRAEEFAKAFEDLKTEFAGQIEEYDKLTVQLDEVLKEEIDQKVLKVSYLDIPENEFSIEELYHMEVFIKETQDELDTLIMG